MLHARIERAPEGLKGQIALLFQQRIGDIALLLFKIGGIGVLALGNLINRPVGAEIQDRSDVPWLEGKSGRELFSAAEVGDGAALAGRLEREGVIVRPLAPFGAPSCVRVTVGLPDENDVFLTALDRSLQPA